MTSEFGDQPAIEGSLELLTVPEAAKMLRISRNLAYELVGRGEIPSLRFGRVIRISLPALNDWVRNQSSKS